MEQALIPLGPGTEPGSAVLFLCARPTEGCVADQRLAGVGPPMGMGVIRVVVLHEPPEPRLEVDRGAEVPLGEEPPREGPEPELHLVQPAAVPGREVEHVPVGRVAQERPPLRAAALDLAVQGNVAPLGDQLADRQAPVGVEVVHDPMVALHVGESRGGMAEMGDEVLSGPRRAQVSRHLPGDGTIVACAGNGGLAQRGRLATRPLPAFGPRSPWEKYID